MSDSILDSTKKQLGLLATYTAFDPDIILFINGTMSTLHQLGIGPVNGFSIEDSDAKWTDFIGEEKPLNAVKTYVYVCVRLLFDPPQTSYALTALQELKKEHEWRLNVHRESVVHPLPLPEVEEHILDGGDI